MSNRGVNRAELEIAQTDAEEITLLIWNTGGGIGALNHPGHAAAIMRRDVETGPWVWNANNRHRYAYDRSNVRYLSFWPGVGDPEKATKVGVYTSRRQGVFLRHHLEDYDNEIGERALAHLDAGAAPRAGQVVIGEENDGSDRWGQKPQALITLPAMGRHRRRRLGLNMPLIVAWMERFRASADFNYVYISRSNNCSGVAARGLCAGGADAFAALGGDANKGSLYFTPNDAQVWANSVRRGINAANDKLVWLENFFAGASAADQQMLADAKRDPKVELPTLAEWRADSKVDWTIRSRVTRSVDAAIQEFHSVPWNEVNYPKRFAAYTQVLAAVHQHLQQQNERTAAYTRLAAKVIGLAYALADEGAVPWAP